MIFLQSSTVRLGSMRQGGVTFIELLISIAVLAILAAIAAPYYGDYIERQRWIGAAEAVYGQIQQAKRASLSNNKQVTFDILSASSTNWCVGYSDQVSCDCGVANDCKVNDQSTLVVSAKDYPGITTTASGAPSSISGSFTMPGITATGKEIWVRSESLGDISVIISTMGRVKMCSDDVSQYPDC